MPPKTNPMLLAPFMEHYKRELTSFGRYSKMNQQSEDKSVAEAFDSSTEYVLDDTEKTQQEVQHVTYIIGHGREVIYHRFELDLSPDQQVETVIKARDAQSKHRPCRSSRETEQFVHP